MNRNKCKAAANRMRREYGEKGCDFCYACCNRQKKNREKQTMVCIAFSNELPWDGAEKSCGLFNVPFRALRPRRIPLEEYFNNARRPRLTEVISENQASLFALLSESAGEICS